MQKLRSTATIKDNLGAMRVQIVDPAAQTPPYDRSLSGALARAGAQVQLRTSHFSHGSVPAPEGYEAVEAFYPRSSRLPSNTLRRRLVGLAEHVPGMLRQRRAAAEADVVHFQWLTVPRLDARLLPRDRPLVLTAHGFLRSADERGAADPGIARALQRFDAIVSHSEYGAERLRNEAGLDPERVQVIPHGAFDYLTHMPDPAPLPAELEGATGPVVLCFGLIRPYKGVDVLLDAFAAVEGAELWIVGRPLGVDIGELRRKAEALGGRVRLVSRFVADAEIPAIFERAELVVLPYRDAEQSGVLYTALAFGKAILASDVGGFGEVAERHRALRTVPPGDAEALAAALNELLSDDAARASLCEAASAAAGGEYSWDSIAECTLALYRRLLDR